MRLSSSLKAALNSAIRAASTTTPVTSAATPCVPVARTVSAARTPSKVVSAAPGADGSKKTAVNFTTFPAVYGRKDTSEQKDAKWVDKSGREFSEACWLNSGGPKP